MGSVLKRLGEMGRQEEHTVKCFDFFGLICCFLGVGLEGVGLEKGGCGLGGRGSTTKSTIWMDGRTMGRFRRSGRHAGASPKLLGNAATFRERRRGSKGGKGEAMPAVERLGRASPPLSVWLGAAAPEEIKKCPGVLVLVLEEEEVDVDSEKDESEKVLFERAKNSSERAVETKKNKRAIFSFF